MPALRPILTLLTLLLVTAEPVLATSPVARSAERLPGQSYFGPDRFVEHVAGNLPIVLTSPHGGRLLPESIADRTEGVRTQDENTQELARAVAAELLRRSGRHAHLVASHLHRRKLDPNREIREAAQGDATAERTWMEFHAAIRGALTTAVAQHGFAFLIDLHGHAHPISRLELGYALAARQLNQTNLAFDASGLIALSTLRDLHERLGGSPSALLRGPGSLGDLFTRAGIRAVPSPQEPQPGNHPFFAGGYIVRTYAAAPDTTKVDGLQIECHRIGIRDTEENRARFARAAADALEFFLRERYRFALAATR
jgi:N-formylglutamate amidohydrolase